MTGVSEVIPLHAAANDDATGVRVLTGSEKRTALLVFFYWVVYENILFFNAGEFGGTPLLVVTLMIKMVLPFYLLLRTKLPSLRLISAGNLGRYVAAFALFLMWALVPTIVDGDAIEWLKLLPRGVFFLSIVALFARRPAAFALVAKCIIIYVLVALLQYILVYATGSFPTLTEEGTLVYMAGPWGLLGNVTSAFQPPGAAFPFVRLCGFWLEPTNSSGASFAAFFLARYLVASGESTRWRAASFGCLLAGLLALSVTGYGVLGVTLLFGVVFGANTKSVRGLVHRAIVLLIAAALLVVVIAGRSFVVENLTEVPFAMAIAGVRSSPGAAYDPTSGRLNLVRMTIDSLQVNALGVGLQKVGANGVESSASAPIYWSFVTGILGVVLILIRESILIASAISLIRRAPRMLPLAQALVAVMAEHLGYGSWMNPNYFIPAVMVLLYSSTLHRGSNHSVSVT